MIQIAEKIFVEGVNDYSDTAMLLFLNRILLNPCRSSYHQKKQKDLKQNRSRFYQKLTR